MGQQFDWNDAFALFFSFKQLVDFALFKQELPAAGLLGLDFFPAYRVISWAAWMVNLALVEYLVRRTRAPGRSYARLATA